MKENQRVNSIHCHHLYQLFCQYVLLSTALLSYILFKCPALPAIVSLSHPLTWMIIVFCLRPYTDNSLISVCLPQGYARQVRRPRCIILVPTRDLARQILSNIKDLSHFSKVRYSMTCLYSVHPSVLLTNPYPSLKNWLLPSLLRNDENLI